MSTFDRKSRLASNGNVRDTMLALHCIEKFSLRNESIGHLMNNDFNVKTNKDYTCVQMSFFIEVSS